MALSNDLISQFVKITNDNSKKKTETTVYGTIVEYNDKPYVRLDGSDLLTPISTTADVKEGERVAVMIKNHTAIVTGNISSPSGRAKDVNDVKQTMEDLDIDSVKGKLAEFETLIADMVTVDVLDAAIVTVTEKLTADEAAIEILKTTKLDASIAEITYATIENLEAVSADFYKLESTYAKFASTTTTKFSAVDASIAELHANKLSAKDIEGKYANIDFSNISKATMEWFYANSGLIEDVVVGDGIITGHLVGVTITGDLIEGNTIKAEKLVIKGSDGLYYKLNTNGVTTESEQTNENSLNGNVIMANSIAATKISVDDLVAFDATIGGFNITDDTIYSGVKETVDNNTRGIYLDSDGQMAIGDASNYIKYYKDVDGNYKLSVSAGSIILATTDKSIEEFVTEVDTSVDNLQASNNQSQERINEAMALLGQLSDSISMLVTDGNGTSLMTQTDEGWTFSTSELQTAINTASENLDSLNNEMGSVSSTVDILQQAVEDLGVIAEYVKIGTYEGEPCIELGEGDSDFKLIITNTRIMFMEGSGMPAYVNNQSLYIKKAIVEEELQQGGFVWKARSNGNLGLVWKGVTS